MLEKNDCMDSPPPPPPPYPILMFVFIWSETDSL